MSAAPIRFLFDYISPNAYLAWERIGELDSHLMLFYTGIKRTASDVAGSYVSNIEDKKKLA